MGVSARILALFLLLAAGDAAGARGAGLPAQGFGVLAPDDWLSEEVQGESHSPLPWAGLNPESPIYVKVMVNPAALRDIPRSALRIGSLAESNLVPVLLLEPPGEGAPGAAALDFDLDGWLQQVDRLLQEMDGKPVLVQVMEDPLARMSASLYAFLIKRVAVAVRAAAPGSRLATGRLRAVEQVESVARWQVGPYLDAVVLDAAAADKEVLAAARLAVPGVSLWVSGAGRAGAGDGVARDGGISYLQEAGLAFSRGVRLVFAAPGGAPEPESLRNWQSIVHPRTVVVPPEFRRVKARAAGRDLEAETLLELEQPDGQRYVVLFDAPAAEQLEFRVSGPRVSVAWIVDLATGEESMGGAADWLQGGGETGGEAVSRVIFRAPAGPLVMRLGRIGSGAPPAELQMVSGQRGLTVEEILANHREVQAAQDRRLRSLEADVRIDFHFSVTTLNRTFDVRTMNRLYKDADNTVYLEKELYLNGARWRGQRAPDLPFVLPERVTEVPLDLHLDRRYSYSLVGTEKLDGAQVYVVAFEPAADDTEAVYRGRIWIDTESFVKRRMSLVELSTELPVISNAIHQDFKPMESGGRTWWLLGRMSGEMIFSALGRNVVLERDLVYTDYEVNGSGFGSRLEDSYASSNPILEETAEGFRRLEVHGKGANATRTTVADLGRTGVSRLLVGVWSIGENFDVKIPFAGVNYFNFNWRDTGTQFNVAWAGPFVDVIWSDPALNDSKVILALEARINPLYSTNRRVEQIDDLYVQADGERLEVSGQRFSFILGRPIGPFHKLEFQADFDYLRFRGEDSTDPSFTVPRDTWQETATARWLYSQRGWRLETALQAGVRNSWQFWGRPDGSDYNPDDMHFVRSRLVLNKSFYARNRNNFGFRGSFYHGNHLDRFSMFDLGGEGVARLPGYNGTGIRFPTGASVDVNGTIGLGPKVSMDMTLSHARFRNEEDLGPDIEHATATSVGVNFAGPFNALMRVRLGLGLGTSLDGIDGGYGLRVTYFRTFRRWFWQKKPQPVAPPGPK
jgi:hypothetical protein